MAYRPRLLEQAMRLALQRGKSILLLGARQTGKSTLAGRFAAQLQINFMDPTLRRRYEARPEMLLQEIRALPRLAMAPPLVFLDEVQRLPECLDMAQQAIDAGEAQFILTGSSARQLRRGQRINLLPGRVVALRLDPLSLAEQGQANLEDLLHDGSLPGIVQQTDAASRDLDLGSYVTTYLDEEVRAEARIRDVGAFARFLECAALEAGNIYNVSRIAEDIGVSRQTINGFFEILSDCLLLERIPPLTMSATRKRLTRSEKVLLFDLGVRRACANELRTTTPKQLGQLFEQWVGLELCRQARLRGRAYKIAFWRDAAGPEVDWLIQTSKCLVPIEVKWTDAPRQRDVRHLQTFLHEYAAATEAFVICRTPRPLQLAAHITALPWQALGKVWDAVR